MSPNAQGKLRILVVDDDRSTRMLLRAYLGRSGHTIFEASNGKEAVDAYLQHRPELILMDVNMPMMTGYEAASIIKRQSGSRFVPIIFLTGLSDDESLARCVESGGDDFLVKPFNSVLLAAKITSMQRIRSLQEELEQYRLRTEQEIALTHHVFDALVKRADLRKVNGLGYWSKSAGHFSGDLLLHAITPGGRLYLMLADFTGHGFSAAIGALPVADVFFTMTGKDYGMREILTELNQKLHELLPVGHFCAVTFASHDLKTHFGEVFNGGLPPLLVVGQDGRIEDRIASGNVALGILDAQDFIPQIRIIDNLEKKTLVLYSDGLTEATNKKGESFGHHRLEQVIETSSSGSPLDSIREAVEQFIGDDAPEDDISVVTLQC
jgi:CheY-like chemotaxis protein